MGLTQLQKVFFWFGALGPLPSVLLYIFLPADTIEFFGGTPTPTALFWCTIASSGDVMFSALCWAVLYHPDDVVLRRSVLWAAALYSCAHWGGFVRAHFMFEPQPGGPWGHIISIILVWAAYIAWGRTTTETTREWPTQDPYSNLDFTS